MMLNDQTRIKAEPQVDDESSSSTTTRMSTSLSNSNISRVASEALSQTDQSLNHFGGSLIKISSFLSENDAHQDHSQQIVDNCQGQRHPVLSLNQSNCNLDQINSGRHQNQPHILDNNQAQIHDQQQTDQATEPQPYSAPASSNNGQLLSNQFVKTNSKIENYSPTGTCIAVGPSSATSSSLDNSSSLENTSSFEGGGVGAGDSSSIINNNSSNKPLIACQASSSPILASGPMNMNASATLHQHTNVHGPPVTAHASDHHNLHHNHHHINNHHSHNHNHDMHYSLPPRSLPSPSPANMALNFSHDLSFLHSGHHGSSGSTSSSNQTSSHHQSDTNSDTPGVGASNGGGGSSGDNNNSTCNNNSTVAATASATSKASQLLSNQTSTTPAFDLGSSESLMQSAAAAGIETMWKNSMNLSHFNRPNVEHNFLPTSDQMNSFTSWSHGGGMGQQVNNQNMPHHILDSPHLMSYTQHHHHQRSSLPLQNQDLVSVSLKNQVVNSAAAAAAPFMLNSMNHQASTSHSVFNHHNNNNEPSHDSLTARAQQQQQQQQQQHHHHQQQHHQQQQQHQLQQQQQHHLDQAAASYNLAIGDNQFYSSPRAENRSHPSAIKTAALLAADRPMQLSFTNHHHQVNQLSYQHNLNNADHTTSQQTASHPLPGSSSGHSAKATGTFRCPHCSEIFSMRNLYQSHLKTHSQERGTKAKFQCELCGHSFSQKTSLNRHMKSHTGERPFPCEVCGKAFSEKERLKIHMRTHTGEKPFSCGICGKSFSQKSTVKRHQTVHTGEKKFKCDCGKGFANRGNLIAHIKTRGSNHFE